MKTTDYDSLMYKSLNEPLSDEEREVLTHWLEEDPDHQRAYDELKTLLDLVDEASYSEPISEEHMQAQRERLEQGLASAIKRELADYRRSLRLRNAAILALLFMMIAVVAVYFIYLRPDNDRLIVETGVNQNLVLPDRSEVTLNQDSRLVFSNKNQMRSVEFHGEAFFMVAENKEEPFVIQLPLGSIKVVGTSFFVRANTADTTEVWVVSGKVQVTEGGTSILLKANDKVTMARGGVAEVTLASNDANFDSWYTGRLHFEKAPLKEVLRKLEKKYHARFSVANPAILKCRFTGTFDNEALPTIMQVLSAAYGFSFRLQDSVYHIEGTSCQP